MRPNESFIGQPVRSLQTMLRVIGKLDRRLPLVIPDGIYGPTTANAVASFQRLNGIEQTGTVDQLTWEEIVSSYEDAELRIGKSQYIEIILEPDEILSAGNSGPYIALLQVLLLEMAKEYDMITDVTVSGIYDEDTQRAVVAFQKLANLPESGAVDRLTWQHISKQFTLHAVKSKM